MEMRTAVIVDACRTAVGKMGGACKPLSALDMACATMKGNLDRTGIDPAEIDEVILGQCRQTSDEPNIARVAALKVGIPDKCAAHTVMRQCASGMTAVQNGAMQIMTGVSDVVLAGGTESMSNAVFYVRGARWGLGTGNTTFVDALTEGQFKSQPEEMYGSYNMGATAERRPGARHHPRGAGRLLPAEPAPRHRRHRLRPLQGRDHPHGHPPREEEGSHRLRHRRVPQPHHERGEDGEAQARLQH